MNEGLTLRREEERRARVLNELDAGRISRALAGELLGVSERQVYRLLKDYRSEGPAGLVHGNRGRAPAHRIADETRQEVRTLARGAYAGTNTTHLAELLAEREEIVLSRASVQRILKEEGLAAGKRRRPRHRSRRERFPSIGMLLQVDGSHHDWLEGRGPRMVLLGAIDDASGSIAAAHFQRTEDTLGYFLLMEQVVARHGLPLALYSDKHAIFRVPKTETIAEQLSGKRAPTQFGRAMEELGIKIITAHSPQAKGRVERLWGTLQSRLVTELRLARISTLPAANAFLADYLARFNQRFSVPPTETGVSYRPLSPDVALADVLCIKHTRIVAKDNTVRFPSNPNTPLFFQLLPGPGGRSYAGQQVELREYPDGSITISHVGQTLAVKPLTLSQRIRPKAASPRATAAASRAPAPPPPAIPATDHPWRRSYKVTKSQST